MFPQEQNGEHVEQATHRAISKKSVRGDKEANNQ